MVNEKENRPKEVKRRFSWENLTKSKDSKKRMKSKNRHHKFILPLNLSAKKTSPKSKSTFKTSTPLKAASEKETDFSVNSTSISQVTFNKPLSGQTTTCSDRLGVPKTSLNDFKKLLLNATNKKMSTKPSAVEQLKLKNESLNASPMKILDLSSSPKSFMNRRVLQLQPSQTSTSSSPYKKVNLMSPRSRWKYNNFSKSSIASIPEANVEDDVITTTETHQDEEKKLNTDFSFTNPLYATPQKKLSVITEKVVKELNISDPQTPTASAESVEPIIAKTESSPETGIIETNFSMEENIFLQAEENNFMRGEIKPYGASFAKKMLQKSTDSEVSKKSNKDEEPNVTATPTLETSF